MEIETKSENDVEVEEKMDVEDVLEEKEEQDGDDEDDDDDDDDDDSDDDDSSEESSDDEEVREEVTLAVSDLDDHLKCFICKGYFRDAHTIVECLHTFCKSCIVKCFRDQKQGAHSCPKCKVVVPGDGFSMLRFDSVMQDLVDKIFPSLKVEDEKSEDEFYRKRNIKRKPVTLNSKHQEKKKSKTKTSTTTTTTTKAAKGGTKAAVAPGKVIQNAQVSFQILPNEDAPEEYKLTSLPKPFLRTPGKLKISHLQKYLSTKLKGEVERDNILFLCRGEKMKSDYTLNLILANHWKDPKSDLILNYQRL